MLHYFRIWLASARYSMVRTMMFRGDFIVWSLVELFWMSVNLLLISVIYRHTNTIAGWSEYEMVLLVGTSMLIQRFLMGFFWSSLFELARNIRSDPKTKDLPIIMITSRIAEKHREHAKELGVDHYLGKPYSEEELLSLVKHYSTQAAMA